jgi:diguanylate cyclase (GGDEF)-like protein
VRHADVISRYGGEEFVVLLPQTSYQQAYRLAERLRGEIALTPIALSHGDIFITVSIGVASLHSEMNGEYLLKAADAGLYKAKQTGKNRVCGPEEG